MWKDIVIKVTLLHRDEIFRILSLSKRFLELITERTCNTNTYCSSHRFYAPKLFLNANNPENFIALSKGYLYFQQTKCVLKSSCFELSTLIYSVNVAHYRELTLYNLRIIKNIKKKIVLKY